MQCLGGVEEHSELGWWGRSTYLYQYSAAFLHRAPAIVRVCDEFLMMRFGDLFYR